MITGLDLVEMQLRVAAGEGLPVTQDDVRIDGHAIECRICAEDPASGFLPETGRILMLGVPEAGHLRFENGLTVGQPVTTDFDPMLAKLVAHGADRAEAASETIDALHDLTLLGVGTNIDYLARVAAHPAFAAGDLHTGFVEEHEADLNGAPGDDGDGERDAALVAALLSEPGFCQLLDGCPEPYASIGGWRN
jgi:propionyl-CoA carboxylase alpha chain/3-methylcrotonyl-CoA carboxylase alpha subunit/acetyl-CoA/propionyl-CoA carboxylase biotin carboxyl carrier protein